MIWQMIEDWFRGILTDGILSNLSGLFDSVNTEVGEIATQVGTTPAGWNAGIFNMIRSLSENVIVPIAGVIITFVMCYELIQLVIEKNNLHDLDTWIFFKWIFKTFVAVLLVTNTWNIVMGVFDITQSVVNDSAGVIISDTSIDNPLLFRLPLSPLLLRLQSVCLYRSYRPAARQAAAARWISPHCCSGRKIDLPKYDTGLQGHRIPVNSAVVPCSRYSQGSAGKYITRRLPFCGSRRIHFSRLL